MSTHFPHVSKPQATVLTMGSLGLALARPCALSAVSALLDEGVSSRREIRATKATWRLSTTPT